MPIATIASGSCQLVDVTRTVALAASRPFVPSTRFRLRPVAARSTAGCLAPRPCQAAISRRADQGATRQTDPPLVRVAYAMLPWLVVARDRAHDHRGDARLQPGAAAAVDRDRASSGRIDQLLRSASSARQRCRRRAAPRSSLPEPARVDYARSFFPVAFIVLIVRAFIFEPFRIPSGLR